MSAFDPNGVAVKNGCYFGFSYKQEEAEVVVVPAPWDVTTSYGDGTSRGPAAILEASTQLDFTSPFRDHAWKTKISTMPSEERWLALNDRLRPIAKSVMETLEAGHPAPEEELAKVNEGSNSFHASLEQKILALPKSVRVVTLGGDHSVSLGPIRAHGARHGFFSILHIDAHADLRESYCGFNNSHASIMHQVSRLPFVEALVQVGLRDLAPQEIEEASQNHRIHVFSDWDLRRATAKGTAWLEQCRQIVAKLGSKVYLSLDVDGLDPKYCPGTGTPVPGGLELWELFCLLEEVESSGREFIGADLVEVSGLAEWDANVGARLLFQICQFLRKRK